MHIKTRLDLIMEALQASREALIYAQADLNLGCMRQITTTKIKRAFERLDEANGAAHGTEERPENG